MKKVYIVYFRKLYYETLAYFSKSVDSHTWEYTHYQINNNTGSLQKTAIQKTKNAESRSLHAYVFHVRKIKSNKRFTTGWLQKSNVKRIENDRCWDYKSKMMPCRHLTTRVDKNFQVTVN